MNNRIRTSAFKLPTEPYPGLRPFLDHEAMLLLGRGRQVRDVIGRLHETHFVAVIGGSGSGKSSLIRAGVVPELRGFGIPDAGDYWVPIVCTPGTTSIPDAKSEKPDAAPAQTPITRLAWKFSSELDPPEVVMARRVSEDERSASKAPRPAAEPSEVIDAKAEAAIRRDEIAATFRQGGGFTRLVRAYSEELPAQGPLRQNARFLFVIDQFEELFHPNNRDNPDAIAMVNAVIDHFYNPHERCFVVLTMRSEHLADCAGYLELPDAINKSSYLVRRLDDDELREAIIGPANFYLRLLQRRGTSGGAPLPDDVVFDGAVVDRLLADVGKITGDPDHLPLLQHVLARTWEAARRRSAAVGASPQIPARIEWADLEHAVDDAQSRRRAIGWLKDQLGVNTLRMSLENWAQATYLDRSIERQKQIDVVLRHLAFKDPNNGQYTQQRIEVDDSRLFPGVAQPHVMLRELLERGFLDSVNYLFWDKENPDRVTLKVSHESFIRGWEHFRTKIDAEAERFEEFVSVLRRCARWKVEERPELLLEAAELVRFDEAGLSRAFSAEDERAGWFHVLLQYRDGERLAKMEPVVDAFIAASRGRVKAETERQTAEALRQRELEVRERRADELVQAAEIERSRSQALLQAAQADTERAQAEAHAAKLEQSAAEAATNAARSEAKAAQAIVQAADAEIGRAEALTDAAQAKAARAAAEGQRTLFLAAAAFMALVFVAPLAWFAWQVQIPVLHAVAKMTSARLLAERVPRDQNVGAARRQMAGLLTAAKLVEEANTGGAFLRDAWIKWSADWFSWALPFSEMRQLFTNSSSEPSVNGIMRPLLTSAMWASETDPGQVDQAKKSEPARSERECTMVSTGASRSGSLFYDTESTRGAFFAKPAATDTQMALHAAKLDGDNKCQIGDVMWSVPRSLSPKLLLDAKVRFLAVATNDPNAGKWAVNFYNIVWVRGKNGEFLGMELPLRSVVADAEAVGLVTNEFASPSAAAPDAVAEVRGVASWREVGGTGVWVAGQSWRLFAEGAQPIDAPVAADWKALEEPARTSGCTRLKSALSRSGSPSGFAPDMRQHGVHCFAIVRSMPPAFSDSAAQSTSEQVRVSVYVEPTFETQDQLDSDPPNPIASLRAFADLAPQGKWLIALDNGPYRGWLAIQVAVASGVPERYLGTPWSTAALSVLARQVQKEPTLPLTPQIPTPAVSRAHTLPASSPPSR